MHFFNKKLKISVAIFLFILISGFLFLGEVKNASAAECQQCLYDCTKADGTKIINATTLKLSEGQTCTANATDGNTYCASKGYVSGVQNGSQTTDCGSNSIATAYNAVKNTLSDGAKTETCWNPANWVSCLLLAVLKFLGWLLSVAALIFSWAANAETLTKVLNGPSIYIAWKLVRDILNMAFILVLVYTAFTIIFQVDSTNKKRILTVVLMALLVNFSFPIARFIIDVGNSLMYTIFKSQVGSVDSIFSNFADKSALGSIINGNSTGASAAQLIGAIVFAAILAITFLMMAMLFVIRIVALAVIIIFSPVAFIGVAIPSMESKAGQWWDYLFKYTFFGPAMALMIYIAIQLMTATSITMVEKTSFSQFGQDPSGGNFIASISAFAVPVVILWLGMGMAQRMGIEGADMAKKVATKAFNKVSGVNWAKKQYEGYSKQRKARQEEKDKTSLGNKLGKGVNNIGYKKDALVGKLMIGRGATRGDKWYKRLPFAKDAKKRADDHRLKTNKEDIKDESEKQEGTGTTTLVENATNNINIAANPNIKRTKEEKIKAAGEIKQAMSRGKEFELVVEQRIEHPDAEMTTFINNLNAKRAADALARGVAAPAPLVTGTEDGKAKIKSEYYAASRKIIDDAEKAK
jgi:hypothetical protein